MRRIFSHMLEMDKDQITDFVVKQMDESHERRRREIVDDVEGRREELWLFVQSMYSREIELLDEPYEHKEGFFEVRPSASRLSATSKETIRIKRFLNTKDVICSSDGGEGHRERVVPRKRMDEIAELLASQSDTSSFVESVDEVLGSKEEIEFHDLVYFDYRFDESLLLFLLRRFDYVIKRSVHHRADVDRLRKGLRHLVIECAKAKRDGAYRTDSGERTNQHNRFRSKARKDMLLRRTYLAAREVLPDMNMKHHVQIAVQVAAMMGWTPDFERRTKFSSVRKRAATLTALLDAAENVPAKGRKSAAAIGQVVQHGKKATSKSRDSRLTEFLGQEWLQELLPPTVYSPFNDWGRRLFGDGLGPGDEVSPGGSP